MSISVLSIISCPQILIILLINFHQINGRLFASQETALSTFLLHPSMEETDVYIGAIFPLHSFDKKEGFMCGDLQSTDGIIPLEAFLFSLDQVNNDKTLLPGIKVGALALDSCNSPEVALQQSLRYMKGFISTESMHDDFGFKCSNGDRPVFEGGIYDKVVGVIGGQRSSVTVQIANVLRLFKVPQISYRSTSASLSDREKFPYFLRTVPTDNNQAEVIIKVMEFLNISYSSLIYSNNEYGIGGYKELMAKSIGTSVCFGTPAHAVRSDDPPEGFDDIVSRLMERKQAKAIVLFADLDTARRVLKAFQKTSEKYIWIGSDSWTSNTKSLDEFSDILEDSSIAIQPLAVSLPGFRKYFTNLTPDKNKRNPWFNEYWESTFNCSLETDDDCSKTKFKRKRNYVEANWIHFIRDSVYAFAHALHNMWEFHCEGRPGLCRAMTHDGHIHGEDLFKYLRNVSFQDSSNEPFSFQESGAGIPRYTVFLYKRSIDGKKLWVPLGNFTYKSGTPTFSSMNEFKIPNIPESFCGKPCGVNQEKKIAGENVCCWSCEECTSYQFLNISTKSCESCNKCEMPNGTDGCVEKPEKFLHYGNSWPITAMAFAGLGIFSTIFVGIIFWVHLDTPVIKAASRELSYILLTGIFISFSMTFAILAPPSPVTCGFTRFFLGFSYTLCYSAILTKTSRIYRIFNKNPAKPQKAKYTSPTSQIAIATLLISVEVVINVSWLMYYEPEVKMLCERDINFNILLCKGIDDFSYIVGFIYPLFLVCLCTIFAIKTRKCPDGFNEARYIAFTNYTTCIIWLIFVPLYLTTPAKDGVRLVSLAMSLSLGAFVQLGCLFIPKVHIVLFKPEKNTRDSVMAQPKTSSQGMQNSIIKHPRSAPAIIYSNDYGPSMHPEVILSANELFSPSSKNYSMENASHSERGSNAVQPIGNVNPMYLGTSNQNVYNKD